MRKCFYGYSQTTTGPSHYPNSTLCNGHHGDGDKADDDDEPPQTNLPPIIADSRDPGGEVRLKV